MPVVEFDVALSFAGEDRNYVRTVAERLRELGINVYYDEFDEINLWGKNLYTYLVDIYHKRAKFSVMFISTHYKQKLWTNLEREAMQSRAFHENQEYILPARFDDTEIPGMLPVVAYLDLRKLSAEQLAHAIEQKLKKK